MVRYEALDEFKKMWTWLYRHPAHDKSYYVKHVAKADPAWKKDCPLCHLSDGECTECLSLWDEGSGSLCEDPNSPMNKWSNTHVSDPNFRSWFAGKIADIAKRAMKQKNRLNY